MSIKLTLFIPQSFIFIVTLSFSHRNSELEVRNDTTIVINKYLKAVGTRPSDVLAVKVFRQKLKS